MFERRSGTKHIYTLKPGEDWFIYQNKIVITHPTHPPKVVNPDGTTTEIEPTWPES
jgi:hypothetical protein